MWRKKRSLRWLARSYVSEAGDQRSDSSKRHTYSMLLRQCNDFNQAKLLHQQIIKEGYAQETYLGNLLVGMFGRCGSLADADQVFHKITQTNLFSWTIAMTAFAQNGQERKSLNLFRQMCLEGVLPDRVAFATVIGACSSLGDLSEGRGIHSSIVSAGLATDSVLAVALVNMYAKAGDFSSAESLFRNTKLKNTVSYTAMIVAYVQFRKNSDALHLYREMHSEGVKPDRVTFLSTLGACASVKDGESVHICIACSGIEDDDVVASALIQMYARCERLQLARRVFDRIPWRSVVVWNSIISALALIDGKKKQLQEEALELYERMEIEGVAPDVVTIVEALGLCSQLRQLEKGRAIHAQIVARRLDSDVTVIDTLINMYRECGSVEEAAMVFQSLARKEDVVAWNTMIAAYAELELPERSIELYHSMNLEGVNPSEVTFVAVLAACSSLEDLSRGVAVHERLSSCGFDSFPVVSNSLMQFYGACGQLGDSMRVFEKLRMKDEVSWNTIMAIQAQHGQCDRALTTYHRMDLEGIAKNDVSFVIVIGCCTSLGESSLGKAIHARVISCGRQQHIGIGSALIDMFGKFGLLEEAVRSFRNIGQRNTVSWNALLSAFSQQGRCREAVEIFRGMQQSGTEADSATYLIVLFACSHGGLLQEAVSCFADLIEDRAIAASQEHYGCVMDLLARAGWLDKAEELMRGMPFEPDSTSLMSLIAACKAQGDSQRGIAQTSGFHHETSAPYVMLHNLFTN